MTPAPDTTEISTAPCAKERRVSAEPAAWATESRCTTHLIACGILLAGFLVRLVHLNEASFGYDEAMHLEAAQQASWLDTYRAGRIHAHPPLIFLFYHAWLPVGDSEAILRLPSLVLGVAGLWIAYLWLSEVLFPRAALAGLFGLAFAPPLVELSVEMRGYTLWLLFLFAGLLCREWAFQTASAALLGVAMGWLALAALTHYATAWVLLILGMLTAVRLISQRSPARMVVVWACSQVLLLALMGLLFFDHARQFNGSRAESDLWADLLARVPFSSGRLYDLKLAIWSTGLFWNYVSGGWWKVLVVCVALGALELFRQSFLRTGTRAAGFDAFALVLLPVPLALALLQLRIYPFGDTRHSAWLIPSVALAFAAGCALLLARWPRATGWLIGVALVGWGYEVTRRHAPAGEQTSPTQMREFADSFLRVIPRHEPIVTDGLTCYVLDYYLTRCAPHERRDLGHAFVEHELAGYRIVTVPGSHLSQVNLKRTWPELRQALGKEIQQPVWIVYLGFQRRDKELRRLSAQLPVERWLIRRRHAALDGELLRVQLAAPKVDPAVAARRSSSAGKLGARREGTP